MNTQPVDLHSSYHKYIIYIRYMSVQAIGEAEAGAAIATPLFRLYDYILLFISIIIMALDRIIIFTMMIMHELIGLYIRLPYSMVH